MRAWPRAMVVVVLAQAAAACSDSADGGGGADTGGASGSATTGGTNATGGSTSTGGATSTGGSGGSGGAGGGVPMNPLCDDFAEHVVAECPSYPLEEALRTCQGGYESRYPFGCGTEYSELVACWLDSPIDCDLGLATGCSAAASVVTACAVAFFGANYDCNGPASNVPGDVTCPAGQFAFACPTMLPASCTAQDMPRAGANACCPPFPD